MRTASTECCWSAVQALLTACCRIELSTRQMVMLQLLGDIYLHAPSCSVQVRVSEMTPSAAELTARRISIWAAASGFWPARLLQVSLASTS